MTAPGIVDTWGRLARFHREATKVMDQHLRTRFGHTLDDYDVLHQINAHGGPIRMGDLAERLVLANSSCTRIVGRLVDGGYVGRTHGAVDRREVCVELTAEGRRLWRRMAVVHTRDIERLVGGRLTGRQQTALDDALRHLLAD